MDPETLETKGLYDFDGQLPSLTFTAHPKFDPETREMICFGYEAKGEGTLDICYYTVGPDGRFRQTVWLVSPVCGLIHDLAVTENYVSYLLYLNCYSNIKWLTYKTSFPGHTANAYENEDGHIVFDLGLSDKNVFFWWPDAQGNSPDPHTIVTQLTRFTIDPKTDDLKLSEPEILHTGNSEFYRIDDRMMSKEYSHSYFDLMDPSLGTDFARIAPVMGGGYPPYNSLAHFDRKTGKTDVYFPGVTHLVQEPVFIPRAGSSQEGDGYVMALVNNYSTMLSELHVLDANDFSKAKAIILLPLRLRPGLHGNWVGDEQ
ncbi:hypothetical protein EIK77_009697 [Talaromyces pinophilus]|nr:hypothetical protein EIK77_009697 [Talaromyces pinophilus]